MRLTENDVRQWLKHTRAKTAAEGGRCLIYYPGAFHRGVRIVVADCKTWDEAFDAVKGRNDLGRVKRATFAPANARCKTLECSDALRMVENLRLQGVKAEVLEHKDVYYVVPEQERDLFSD